jgi:hypothetical protein
VIQGFDETSAMMEANRPPSLPGWVAWFTTAETTRASLRRDAWLHVCSGFVLSGLGALAGHFGWFTWKVALIPAAWVVVGLWMFAAGAWLDRNQAWQRLAGQPQHLGMSRVGGGVLLLLGLLLLTLSVWRFWVCLLGPDDSLWGSEFMHIAQEELQLAREYNARVKAIEARGGAAQELAEETRRFLAASNELHRRKEQEVRAAAPWWRWVEFGVASVVLLMGLLFCWGGYRALRAPKGDRAAESGTAADRPRD